MKKSVLNANALTVVDNQEVLLENGSFFQSMKVSSWHFARPVSPVSFFLNC